MQAPMQNETHPTHFRLRDVIGPLQIRFREVTGTFPRFPQYETGLWFYVEAYCEQGPIGPATLSESSMRLAVSSDGTPKRAGLVMVFVMGFLMESEWSRILMVSPQPQWIQHDWLMIIPDAIAEVYPALWSRCFAKVARATSTTSSVSQRGFRAPTGTAASRRS
jgi:hypothetical protein